MRVLPSHMRIIILDININSAIWIEIVPCTILTARQLSGYNQHIVRLLGN